MSEQALHAASIAWLQAADSCDSSGCPQRFRAEIEDAGVGIYVVVSTERWALNDEAEIDRLAEALKAFLRQAPEDA